MKLKPTNVLVSNDVDGSFTAEEAINRYYWAYILLLVDTIPEVQFCICVNHVYC